MSENGRKRREWIKTIAIIFLVILLILTFFSNTIMNYSLPEVAAQYVQPGNINAQIRGYGTIESGDPYSVKIKTVRKVESVEVYQGDFVEKGQVLCLLSGEDSELLSDAKKALELAEAEFEIELLNGTIDVDVMNNAGKTDSMQNYKAKIISLQNEIAKLENEENSAKAKVSEWDEKNESISLQIGLLGKVTVDATNEQNAVNTAQKAFDEAELALSEVEAELKAVQEQIEQYSSVSDGDSIDLKELEELKNLEIELSNKKEEANTFKQTAESNLKAAEKALEDKLNSNATQIKNLEVQLAQIDIEKSKAQKILSEKSSAIEAKKKELEEFVKSIQDAKSLETKYDAIVKAREEVERLEELAEGSEVVAPISGTIESVNVKSGLDTPEDGIVFTMQPEGEGYTLSFTVTNEQAKKLSVGDVAEPVNAWRYDDMQIILSSIRPDTTNPGQNKLLIFSVSGENIVPNQSLNVSVAQRSGGSYEMVVPNSAIREDNNGKFVLIVESKSSPIGTRYIANRVDVDVIASDDTQSAITGALYGYEFVITTSTKPVEAGQYVRLAE